MGKHAVTHTEGALRPLLQHPRMGTRMLHRTIMDTVTVRVAVAAARWHLARFFLLFSTRSLLDHWVRCIVVPLSGCASLGAAAVIVAACSYTSL